MSKLGTVSRLGTRAAAALLAGPLLAGPLLAGPLVAAAIAAMMMVPWSTPAPAQGLALNSDSQTPLEINADDGIEWRQAEKVYIARGNASATRGGVTVRADTLTAHYRETPEGGTDIWRIDAAGRVRIKSAGATAVGDKGVYDVGNGILVLTGGNLKMDAENYTVTARDSLEYWEPKRMAVARGNAVVVQGDKRLSADVVTAYFEPAAGAPGTKAPGTKGAPKTKGAGAKKAPGTKGAAKESPSLQRIEAFGNVRISTPGQVARAKRGVYDIESGIATLYGSVKITRGENQLDGEYGEVNLNTGVSRLMAAPPGEGGSTRVRGLFSPRKKPSIGPRKGGAKTAPAP